jgi:hypothetical protein
MPHGDRNRAWTVLAGLVLALGLARPGAAATFECASADVVCLITAINTANTNGEADTIRLPAGTYTVRAVDNDTDGSNGLPSISSPLTIVGAGFGNTIIEREAVAPPFRLLPVGSSGHLKLQGLTVRGGRWGGDLAAFGGGGLLNLGTAIISQCAFTGNQSITPGLFFGGGGAIASHGRLILAGSSIASNVASRGAGGGINSPAGVTIVNSTIRGNVAASGGGLFVSGGIVVNTTIALNSSDSGGQALASSSALALQNTIVAGPSEPPNPGYLGQVTSLDNNVFIDRECAVALLAEDLTAQSGDRRGQRCGVSPDRSTRTTPGRTGLRYRRDRGRSIGPRRVPSGRPGG